MILRPKRVFGNFRLIRTDTGGILRECSSLDEALERSWVHEVLAGLPAPVAVEQQGRDGQWQRLGNLQSSGRGVPA